MRKLKAKTFKKGAASFYVVAFSTLILVIIAASFAANESTISVIFFIPSFLLFV